MIWPPALPPLPITASGRFDSNSITTEVDSGPRKKRRRYTAVGRRIAVRNWHLKGDDLETLFYFWETETSGGAEAFTITNPLNGMGEVTARFSSDPSWEIVIPSGHAGTRVAVVEFDLEILP